MKHALWVALALGCVACAGAEPIPVTSAQPPVVLDLTRSPPAPRQAAPSVEERKADNTSAAKEPPTQGILAVLNVDGDPGAPRNDSLSAQGHLWGTEIGDSFGSGGLGLRGVQQGGGGEGIGLGTVGALAHGAGTGQGFGTGRGQLGGAPAKPPQVRMGATQVTGRLPPEVIQRIVRQNFGRFRLCYEAGLKSNADLAGKVAIKFTIEKDGAVGAVSDGGSDMPDKNVTACVRRAFNGLSFPEPEGGGQVVVVYPIVFSTGDRAQPPAPTIPKPDPDKAAPPAPALKP